MAKDDLSKLVKGIQKSLGGAAKISKMSEVAAPFLTRLPTGILSLDLALKGGFPAGSMHQLFGPDGAGKDYLSNLVISQVQKEHGEKANIAWMSFGYKPDIPFMEMCGIDPELGNLMFIDIGSEEALEQPAESLLTAMLDLIRSNKFQLMVINELGSGETKDNVKKGLHEDAKIATWASLMSTFCQKFYSAMRTPDEEGNANKTCVIMINPVMHGQPSISHTLKVVALLLSMQRLLIYTSEQAEPSSLVARRSEKKSNGRLAKANTELVRGPKVAMSSCLIKALT